MEIFTATPGTVAIMDAKGALPGRIYIQDFDPLTAVLVDASIDQATNQQFQTTLADAIYMYVFGDQMGRINLHGLAFISTCKGDGGDTGLESVLEWYKTNRAAMKSDPILVHVGKFKLSGFLTAMNVRAHDPDKRVNSFTLQISTLPES